MNAARGTPAADESPEAAIFRDGGRALVPGGERALPYRSHWRSLRIRLCGASTTDTINIMLRTRDESKWNFSKHKSVEEFLAQTIAEGAHTIQYRGADLDILVEDRGAETTLVVFHSAVPVDTESYPKFSGRRLAQDVEVNLISVSDPALAISRVGLAWHLGTSETGPLREVWVKLISHALNLMSTKRTILFGSSGGGYAAANLAGAFPGSLAFIVNPRLTFEEMAEVQLSSYLNLCHGHEPTDAVSTEALEFFASYGITNVADSVTDTMNHHILVYQNVGDRRFMASQAAPFLKMVHTSPNVLVRFGADDFGHKPIPGQVLREIVQALASAPTVQRGIAAAGFSNYHASMASVMREFPRLFHESNLLRKKVAAAGSTASRAERKVTEYEMQVEQLEAAQESSLSAALARNEETERKLAIAQKEIAELKRPPAALRCLVRGGATVVTRILGRFSKRVH